MTYPISYDPKTDKWITYTGEFNGWSQAWDATKPPSAKSPDEKT